MPSPLVFDRKLAAPRRRGAPRPGRSRRRGVADRVLEQVLKHPPRRGEQRASLAPSRCVSSMQALLGRAARRRRPAPRRVPRRALRSPSASIDGDVELDQLEEVVHQSVRERRPTGASRRVDPNRLWIVDHAVVDRLDHRPQAGKRRAQVVRDRRDQIAALGLDRVLDAPAPRAERARARSLPRRRANKRAGSRSAPRRGRRRASARASTARFASPPGRSRARPRAAGGESSLAPAADRQPRPRPPSPTPRPRTAPRCDRARRPTSRSPPRRRAPRERRGPASGRHDARFASPARLRVAVRSAALTARTGSRAPHRHQPARAGTGRPRSSRAAGGCGR